MIEIILSLTWDIPMELCSPYVFNGAGVGWGGSSSRSQNETEYKVDCNTRETDVSRGRMQDV